jgi:hypothetical protein
MLGKDQGPPTYASCLIDEFYNRVSSVFYHCICWGDHLIIEKINSAFGMSGFCLKSYFQSFLNQTLLIL